MKLSNFRLDKTEGNSALNKVFFASVDVEEGALFWKKTERRNICRRYTGNWYFVDSGEFTPEMQAERLARAWFANTGQEV